AALDPGYSDAWETIADIFQKQGRTDEALAALDGCLHASPNSVDCVRERAGTLRNAGRCAEMEAAARQWIARDPESADAYLALAHALAAEGRPTEAIGEALRQRWARLPAPAGQRREAYERGILAAFQGDFASAERLAGELDRAVEGDPSL